MRNCKRNKMKSKKMSYLVVGVSPGTAPVYHSTNLKLLDKRIKIAELVLRFMILGLGVVAAILIGTDSQVKVFFSFEKEAKFTDVKALVFWVVANGLAAGYSLIQGLHCVVSLVRGSVLFNKPLAWAIFSVDQITSYFFLLSYTLWLKHKIIKILASTSCFFLKHFVAMLINITYFFINSCKDKIKNPGIAPVYHSTNLKLLDRKIKIAELVLRFMILSLGVISAILIGTDSQVKVLFSLEKEAKFTDAKALVFLIVANGFVAGYSLIQGLHCVVSLVRGSVLFNKPLAWAIFSADQCLGKMSYLGVGVSPGIALVYHSTNLKLLDKRIKIAELVLRFMILGLGVVSAVLIGTDSQVKVFFSFEKEAKFTDVMALVFLVVANGLAAGYSLI
ncbi:hypothetical protein Ahy_B04g073079 [Arachis hypogaea]|uniref:CASP-like protein n=1 Tax=Arachis hypogaea TaxID=3818 RepID=A0A444ZPL3_ARAHY|nr:hypothetical protein Ahy_B04g073079 [Arachis hypogaea]